MTTDRSNIRFLTIFNAVFLVIVLVIQQVWRWKLQALEMELPGQTVIVLGPVLPTFLGVLLVMTVAARVVLPERYVGGWEIALTLLLGIIAGYFITGLWLPYCAGPERLT